MSATTAIGLPRMLLYPVGGMAFGFSAGLLWNLLGTLIGAYATFTYARWAGQSLVTKKWPAISQLTKVIEGRGVLSVALLRQIPSPGFLTNLIFGISPVRRRAFLGGTLIGCLPSAIPATLIGTSVAHETASVRVWMITLSFLSIIMTWLVFSIYLGRSRRFAAMRKAWGQR
jgi:uncharacterized membrane protein YdjX (TVP38/TMEM64 family)